jgi:hypothetical protein
MPRNKLYSGEVHFINHTDHTGSSRNTMKDWHFAVILTHNNLLMRDNYPLVSYVPMTSFKREKHWNEEDRKLRYYSDFLLKSSQYSALDRDTIVDCAQIFTCDYECLNDSRFRLTNGDLKEVRKRVAFCLGYSSL